MGRPTKTQWEFDDLFAIQTPVVAKAEQPAVAEPAAAPVRKILSVSELTAQIRRLLESQVGFVWVSGEITNLRIQSSGHVYFTLKDAATQIGCVLFRGEYQVDRSLLQDGRKVTVR